MILSLAWLEKWNPMVYWVKMIFKIPRKSPNEKAAMKVTLCKLASLIKEKKGISTLPAQKGGEMVCLIPKEYWGLEEVFSERESEVLPPHCPIHCYQNLAWG